MQTVMLCLQIDQNRRCAWLSETVQVLTRNGVPVCVHLGLTPQSVHVFGGYKLQARTREAADQLIADCTAVVEAGAAVLLLECVPAQLKNCKRTSSKILRDRYWGR